MTYGSFHNLMYAGTKPKTPKVGDGATVLHWTDRSAATVVKVSASGKTIWVQDDTATRTDKNGMSDGQSYTFARNPDGFIRKATLRKDGRYRVSNGTSGVMVGRRDEYYDYTF